MLAVTGVLDSHRGPAFLVGPDGQGAPTARRASCRFPHRFRDFREGFGCFRRGFGPRGHSARVTPREEAHTLSAPLGYVPELHHLTPI